MNLISNQNLLMTIQKSGMIIMYNIIFIFRLLDRTIRSCFGSSDGFKRTNKYEFIYLNSSLESMHCNMFQAMFYWDNNSCLLSLFNNKL